MAVQTHLPDTEVLSRIARMELVATQAVEGFLAGKHPSPYHGSSVEYADHRPYSLGDPIRTIDWKLLAKTDKYYIKLFEEQTNVRGMVLLDISKSMSFGSEEGSKFDYACMLAASLSYLMVRQNDAVGLAMFGDDVDTYLPSRCTASHFRRMIEMMDATSPRSATKIGQVLHALAGRMRRRGLVVLISDLLDDPAEIANGIAHLRYQRHEVIVFHVVDREELSFPYERMTRFKDLEGVGMVIANPRSMRRRYLQRLTEHFDGLKRGCMERGASYEQAVTDTAYDQMLSAYLAKRMRLRRTAKVG